MSRRGVALVGLWAAVGALFACGGGFNPQSSEWDIDFGCDPADCSWFDECCCPPPDECATSADCGVDRVCGTGPYGNEMCVGKPCHTDDDCSASGFCDLCASACAAAQVCETDADCEPGAHCGFPNACSCDGAASGGAPCDVVPRRTKRICSVDASVACGPTECQSFSETVLISFAVPGCCLSDGEEPCGLDISTMLPRVVPSCQRLHQPGTLDSHCPGAQVFDDDDPLFKVDGCCRPDGKCGLLLDQVIVFSPGLGCMEVDAGPRGSLPCVPQR